MYLNPSTPPVLKSHPSPNNLRGSASLVPKQLHCFPPWAPVRRVPGCHFPASTCCCLHREGGTEAILMGVFAPLLIRDSFSSEPLEHEDCHQVMLFQ